VTAAEANAYRVDVRQHIYWLSQTKFREYYRLSKPEGEGR